MTAKKKEEKKPYVAKITLVVHGKQISLSLDETRELKEILGQLFGGVSTTVWYPWTSYYASIQPKAEKLHEWKEWKTTTTTDELNGDNVVLTTGGSNASEVG